MKERLDKVIKKRRLIRSRTRAQRMIQAGRVRVNGRVITRPGHPIDTEATIEILSQERYVSRGGEKLEGALTGFSVDPTGLVCLDIGSSTGGFTDCLIKHGAARVHAVDVGSGQLDQRLRHDRRVVVHENLNARYLAPQEIGEPIDLATIDVSFISLRLILPGLEEIIKSTGTIVSLVKPQYEAGRENVGKGGVVRDTAVHLHVLQHLQEFIEEKTPWTVVAAIRSPLLGPAGNIEFFFQLSQQSPGRLYVSEQDLTEIVSRAHDDDAGDDGLIPDDTGPALAIKTMHIQRAKMFGSYRQIISGCCITLFSLQNRSFHRL
ncbi:TlyA family RNA methyltransferase, partial [Candidatus Bipolaricaulota bacterium]|nr:TlyA family RNA methyltransferase [Candidatus Bipolaricaulota bacterium]